MPVNDALGTRMKTYYEQIPKTQLMRRTPVAIRIDGKAFHTFTRGFQKPFDQVLGNSMVRTMEYLCQNIQGCVFGYTQSDEIWNENRYIFKGISFLSLFEICW